MNISEVIKQKFEKLYPESLEIFKDSCQYSIDNGLSFIKGILLYRENEIKYMEQSAYQQELSIYLKSFGYEYILFYEDMFLTKKGYEKGFIFVVFFSKASIDLYIQEQDNYNKWNYDRWVKEPERPIYKKIKYLDIYH